MRENGTFLAIVALATVAVLGDAPGGAGEAPTQAQAEAPAARDSSVAGGEICDSDAVMHQIDHLYPGFKREVIIATVPDPIDSQAGWLFDAQLEAIVGAIERKVPVESAANYTRDRYVLPWNCAARAGQRAHGAPGARPGDPRETPGLVVFRNRNQRKLLLLFLVGETPTFGIHENALSSALDAAAQAEGCGPTTRLRLMAPTFTGSAMSLRAGIEHWWDDKNHCPTASFKIISGSASDFRNKEIIERPLLRTVKPAPTVSFQATVVPEEAVLNAVYKHLKDRGAKLGHDVALLAEAGTFYGKSAYADSSRKSADADSAGPLVLTFPMRMGRLRSAGGAESPRKAIAATPNGESLLGLGLDDIGAPRDLFPTFFPRMHNPSDELVLGHLLSTISKEHYRYVGLLATDPRDKLYLAKLIRRYCPDVGLFTVQSDLLYAHPEYNRYLEGMLVGSTYPLFNSNQLWSPPWQGSTQRLQFPRNMAQGAYNATLALLDRRELVDYGAPFGSQPGHPEQQPPIWLTVVGHEALWPLKAEVGYRHLLRDENRAADERGPYTYVNTPPEPPTAAERLYHLVTPRHFQLVGLLVTWGLVAHVWVWGRRYARWRQIGVSGWEWWCFWLPAVVLFLLVFLLGLLWWWVGPAGPPLDGVSVGKNDASVGRALFALRSANLQSGVSVLTPLLFVTLAAYLVAFAQLKRLRLPRERRTEPALQERLAQRFGSSLDHTGGCGEVSTLEGAIEDAAHRWHSDWRWTGLVLLVVFGSAIFGLLRVIPVIDSKWWHYGLFMAQSMVLLVVLRSYVRFAVLWRELRKLLQHFCMHPMVGAFERLPRRLIGHFRWHPLPAMPHTGPLLGQYFQLLAHHIDVVDGGSAHEVAEALKAAQSTHGRLALAMPPMAAVVRTERWLRPPLTSAPEAANLAVPVAPTHDPRQVWFDRAEELIAIHVAQYINYVFLHLWNLLTCAMLALLLLLFASHAYPLQPQRLQSAFLFAIAVTVVGWTLRVLVQINRNDLLSRIQKTEPNKTTFDRPLVAQFLLYGVLPILSLLAMLFPDMAGVFSWIADILRLVK
jgi:hypothetical protein